jgi:hypothetical protein
LFTASSATRPAPPVQADYLFALTWRHILNELGGLNLPPEDAPQTAQRSLSLQSWLINVTALCINQAVLPEVEEIHYSLADASPPCGAMWNGP